MVQKNVWYFDEQDAMYIGLPPPHLSLGPALVGPTLLAAFSLTQPAAERVHIDNVERKRFSKGSEFAKYRTVNVVIAVAGKMDHSPPVYSIRY